MSKKFLFCKKVGMTQIIQEDGVFVPVTVLEVEDNKVVRIKSLESDGYNAVLLGFSPKKAQRCNKPETGFFAKNNIEPLKHLKEVRVDADHSFQAGDTLNTDVFEEGDVVSVRGKSKGLGYTGTIKRWNFKRGLMTHGSKTHRIPGSIGAGTTPSRVYKGKKMAGRKGMDNILISNLKVIKKDANYLFIKGAVPGKKGTIIEVVGA